MALLNWDIYEIHTTSQIVRVMCRGRIRKFAISQNITLITENASDKENMVRFAVLEGTDITLIEKFLNRIFENVQLEKILTTQNPVISKLKVNIADRYKLE